jgi:hypothetical protein
MAAVATSYRVAHAHKGAATKKKSYFSLLFLMTKEKYIEGGNTIDT